MDETQGQHKKQYDWLKGYQFKKGQSGNPGGMKPGTKSMKTWAREYLETLPEEERLEFIGTLPTDLVWRMAEGNPKQDTSTDITSGGKPIPILNGLSSDNVPKENSQP